MDKTVECGSCDYQFKVTGDTEVKERQKFYPGEKRGAHLNRFGNSKKGAAASSSKKPVGFKQAHYQPDINADLVGPPRPRRTMSAMLGVRLMIMVIFVFFLERGRHACR